MHPYQIAFFDIDGTLVSSMAAPSRRVKEALRKARENGHGVCLCTGRNMPIIGQEIMDSYVGRRLRVLPEGPGREEGTLASRSDGNLIVEFPGDPSLVGNFVEVQITGAMNWALKGEVVK